MADVKLTNIDKTYGGNVNVLNGINLDIQQGELVVFVGPSGCGKSTLLRMIAGLEKITGGTLEIDGQVRGRGPSRISADRCRGMSDHPRRSVPFSGTDVGE